MLYDFKCKECDHEQVESFAMADYDKKVMENGRLKRKKCEKCKTISLFRNIIHTPNTLGGPGGYVSMERWQSMHPENTARKKAEIEKKMNERHRKRVTDRIDKGMRSIKKK